MNEVHRDEVTHEFSMSSILYEFYSSLHPMIPKFQICVKFFLENFPKIFSLRYSSTSYPQDATKNEGFSIKVRFAHVRFAHPSDEDLMMK
jgi:hypothetical protein